MRPLFKDYQNKCMQLISYKSCFLSYCASNQVVFISKVPIRHLFKSACFKKPSDQSSNFISLVKMFNLFQSFKGKNLISIIYLLFFLICTYFNKNGSNECRSLYRQGRGVDSFLNRGVGAGSSVMGIICPLGLNRVN